MSNYRILVTYDPERSVFLARAPELEQCSGEGATRAEAVGKVEEEIDAQVRNMREQGVAPPPAVDEVGSEISGEIAARVSRTLHRDLLWQARLEGVELGQLVGEMLAGALDARRAGRGRRPEKEVERGQRPEAPRDDRRPFRQGERGQGGRYHAIMEDRATFLEYVRGLESGGGRGPGGQGGGGGPPRRRGGRGRGPGGGQGGEGGPPDDNEGPK